MTILKSLGITSLLEIIPFIITFFVMIVMGVFLLPLQIIILLITLIEYPFVRREFDNLQELFTFNSAYIEILFNSK